MFSSAYANVGDFGNLQGVFPVPICKTLTAPWTKISQGQKNTLKGGISFGLVKGLEGSGLELRLGVSIPVLMGTQAKAQGLHFYFAERHEQMHQLICRQHTLYL